MYKELDKYITEFAMEDFPIDYWFDEGASIAEDMIQKFDCRDWEALREELPKKTIGWKRRLSYCLHDSTDIRGLEVLLILINTDDEELFETSVDSLRCFENSIGKEIIYNNSEIKKKIETLMPNVGIATRKIFEEILR